VDLNAPAARALDLGAFGVWTGQLRGADPAEALEAAAELEELGYGAIWFPGGRVDDAFELAAGLLGATQRAVVATGILSVWLAPPEDVAARYAATSGSERFLLGLGISHAPLVERLGQRFEKPIQVTRAFLDGLDAAAEPVPKDRRCLAALGPRMLELARERTAGTHPYNVTPEHTRAAREILGAGPLLAPEQMVVLETDPVRARAVARETLARYLELPNYTNTMLRTGFTADDLAGGGSDRLVDGIIAWGDAPTVLRRVHEHLDAGADHVCVQLVGLAPSDPLPRAQWRELAEAWRAGT
jgi:probable F420-dependent oxidoreductase